MKLLIVVFAALICIGKIKFIFVKFLHLVLVDLYWFNLQFSFFPFLIVNTLSTQTPMGAKKSSKKKIKEFVFLSLILPQPWPDEEKNVKGEIETTPAST